MRLPSNHEIPSSFVLRIRYFPKKKLSSEDGRCREIRVFYSLIGVRFKEIYDRYPTVEQ
jgi:hypothetical protein